jgi:hypothetical protein
MVTGCCAPAEIGIVINSANEKMMRRIRFALPFNMTRHDARPRPIAKR